MVGGVKSPLESNLMPARDAQWTPTNLVCTRTQKLHRDWDRTCLSVSYGGTVSSGLPQGQGLWAQQTWVWHKPSWRRSPLTYHRATRTYTGLGKQTLGGHKQNFVHTRTQEKGAVTPQETDPDLPVSVHESLVEAWIGGGLLQGWGHWV